MTSNGYATASPSRRIWAKSKAQRPCGWAPPSPVVLLQGLASARVPFHSFTLFETAETHLFFIFLTRKTGVKATGT